MAIHSKALLDDTEKLAYLSDTLNEGPVRPTIESLTHDAECYKEAIDCCQKHYDQQCITHRAHTYAIVVAPSVKDGNSKYL